MWQDAPISKEIKKKLEEYRIDLRTDIFSGKNIRHGCYEKHFSDIAIEEMVKATQQYIYVELPSFHEQLYGKTSWIALAEAMKRKIDIKIVINRQNDLSSMPDKMKETLSPLEHVVRYNPYIQEDYAQIETLIPWGKQDCIQHGVLSFDGHMSHVHLTSELKWVLVGPEHHEIGKKISDTIHRRWSVGREMV
ncbi:MAG: hypothetical protein IKV03_05705 [Alphaproteobacteria bacterium]|nr:hypothetical protein [Alphaproteobacteria bacterium]